jgi:hypothetical protein
MTFLIAGEADLRGRHAMLTEGSIQKERAPMCALWRDPWERPRRGDVCTTRTRLDAEEYCEAARLAGTRDAWYTRPIIARLQMRRSQGAAETFSANENNRHHSFCRFYIWRNPRP